MGARISCLFFAFLIVSPAQAQEFWEKKDYRRWSERECRKLLENSPWAKRRTPMTRAIREDRWGRVLRETAEAQAAIVLYYQVQLRSALPIRQALVRLAHIRAKYDELSPDEQQRLDTEAEQFLAASFPDTVVIHVVYRTNTLDWDRELAQYWQHQTTDTLKSSVFLLRDKEARIPLLRYSLAGGDVREFELVFPRLHQGRPLVTPQDKTLVLEFPHPELSWRTPSRVVIEFKVEEILVNGVLVY